MSFTNPLFLLLLLILPVIAWLGWPRRGVDRRREIISLALRLAIALSLVLALAGFSFVRLSKDLAVVFLIDISDSMPPQAVANAEAYVQQAMQSMGPEDGSTQAAVVVFGRDALVERGMSTSHELGKITSIPATDGTDLSSAIRLGLALYPPGAARRMVILSDGADTTLNIPGKQASLDQAARLASASGVQVVVVPYSVQRGPEILVENVDAPPHLRQGERFDMQVTLQATQAGHAGVRVLAGGEVVYDGSVDVRAGRQTLALPLQAGDPGFVRYTVQIIPDKDGYYQNNEMAAYSQVAGPPRVLVIAPPAGEKIGPNDQARPDESAQLIAALKASGFAVDTGLPSALPDNVAGLAGYSSLVVVDVPARELSNRQMQAVQSYVRDLGGGFVMVGGPTSYGVGGYFKTPIEETLPVEMQIKDEKRRPSLTIVFIIDHSGSMGESSGGVVKVELAKEAVIRSISLMNPIDRVGVIAFDDTASWVVPITELSNPQQVINAVGSIRPGGGTDILTAVQTMAKVLPGDPSKVKHVILLTDGGADPTGIPELVKSLYSQYGITLSTVGVGSDAAPYLQDLAKDGGGRYHFTADPSTIPSIFTEETAMAMRSYLIEETFYPKAASQSPILAGISSTPPLYGYVGTTAKDAAQTILISDKNDPVLAAWQYGLGKAVAFTSDATGRWGKDWVTWQGFPSFWAQVVRYTASDRSGSDMDVRVEKTTSGARLVVDAYQAGQPGGSGAYLDGYNMKASLVAPDGKATALDLQQMAPGRYEADFKPAGEGAYLVDVAGGPQPGQGGGPVSAIAGWVESYSPEYSLLTSDPDVLVRLAAQTGGWVASADPAQAFARTLPAIPASRPAWPELLALAALLLPLDIAVRRLILTRTDLARGWEKMNQAAQRVLPTPKAASEPAHSEKMSSLLQVKGKTRREGGNMESAIPARPEADQAKPASPAEKAAPEPEEAPPVEKPEGKPGESTAAALLARKRSRNKQ